MSTTAETPLSPNATRHPDHPVDSQFIKRWSPRALSADAISTNDLMILFEAARWAPSSYNGQPWRFIYGIRGSAAWQHLLELLNPHNQTWAKNSGALILLVSRKTFENGNPSRTHTLDAGAAWMSLAMQASLKGLIAHGMEGFDYDRARAELKIGAEYAIEAMIAVGRPGHKADLPPPLQAKEFPNDRKKVSEIAFEGALP